ncbi:MAG: ABC transporter ATP-binding protein, partial [Phycisphaeraceae bacterium]
MTDAAIQVEGLSKRYRLGATQGLSSRFMTLAKGRIPRRDSFWALKDVSFEVPRGEVLGVIGGNGAGKSTLLKILSRITDPTEGRAVVRGRVGSLLEVGTGFHPELTGKENIFLSGAVLGMSRAEVKRRFDEIVDFAGVEKFLHTPVKRYSSGMYVRLAFAVAAHLQPEVLIVDEVLAVGDASFQSRCLGRMSEVAKSGRTVLFVSHNMAAISQLCQQVLLLRDGQTQLISKPEEAIARYLPTPSETHIALQRRTDRCGNGTARFDSLSIRGAHG